MNKYFVAVFANDETKTFGAIEPFNDAFFAWRVGWYELALVSATLTRPWGCLWSTRTWAHTGKPRVDSDGN
jgi:hypothetical protein